MLFYAILLQVSPLTERERVYHWLNEVDVAPPNNDNLSPSNGCQGDKALLSSTKLNQTVGMVTLCVADSLRDGAHFKEACDVYKYALGIFQEHPPSKTNDA